MKKLTPPTQQTPAVYLDDKKENILQQHEEKKVDLPSTSFDVPPKTLHSYNLKKIKSFKQIRRKYKLSNQEKIFIQDLSVLLNEYNPNDYQFDQDLLVHVLNIAESFFIYGNTNEREEIKQRAVKQLLQPYFRNDEEIYEMMVSSVWHNVKKSNLLKRLLKRTVNFFLMR